MKRMVMLAVAATLVAGAGPVWSQGRGQGPQVVSPEVHADRRVTVRIRAPGADSVTLTGEILDGKPAPAMLRDSSGMWSVTTEPLAPDIYTYAFRVDGVSTPDPVNPYLKPPATTGLASQVEVPGDGPQYYDFRPVPHGTVSIVQYQSTAIGAPRTAWVYTPPNYSQSAEPYPLLFLLHGIGETENSWVVTGRAHVILDNLIAEGRARPMVVVMPLGHVRQSIGLVPWSPAQGAQPPAAAGAIPEVFNSGTLQRDLLGDLLPLVERNYRVSRNPDVANQKLKLLHLTIGRSDGLIAGNQRFDEALTRAGIRHTFRTTEGGHWFRVWRRDLYEIAPMLFR